MLGLASDAIIRHPGGMGGRLDTVKHPTFVEIRGQ